jgi:hypothetical protein
MACPGLHEFKRTAVAARQPTLVQETSSRFRIIAPPHRRVLDDVVLLDDSRDVLESLRAAALEGNP